MRCVIFCRTATRSTKRVYDRSLKKQQTILRGFILHKMPKKSSKYVFGAAFFEKLRICFWCRFF
jgi:hypothetical protein